MEDNKWMPICIKEEINTDDYPENKVKIIETDESVKWEVAQHHHQDKNYFVKSELIDVKVEDVKFESSIIDKEPPTESSVEDRLLESKKLLIARKYDIRLLCGKNSDPNTYRCSFCPYQNSKKTNVEKHALIHKKLKEFKCDLCPYECHWKSWLVRHKQCHQPKASPGFKCHKCNYSARFKICLDRHILNHDKLKPFSCPLCSYKGNSQAYLRSHMTIHSKIKPYTCQECNGSFPRKKHLLIHLTKSHSLKKHRKKKSKVPFAARTISGGFECDVCDYRCGKENTLKKHLRQHFYPQEYACDECSYKSNRKDLLDSHKLTHSSVKKHVCDKCGFKSHWSHCLRRHMYARHLNFRPFTCSECDYASADKSNLKKHVIKHLEALSCNICNMEFKSSVQFKRHKIKFHKSVSEDSKSMKEVDCIKA